MITRQDEPSLADDRRVAPDDSFLQSDETREVPAALAARGETGEMLTTGAVATPGGSSVTSDTGGLRCRAIPASVLEARVGRRYGERYQIRRLLGRGGMGAVYVAFDEILEQEVALKFLLTPDGSAGADVAVLRGEVQLGQRVTHENVCRTYDLEQIDGDLVLKMEYVAGETLAERLRRRGPLPVAEAFAVARQITHALEAAHAQGVVHRDLKPDNILIEAHTGRVVLMDFGIADAFRGTSDEARAAMGTPAYMAPEQIRRQPVDGRTDFYALGCTLYELLTGTPPFTAASPVMLALRQLRDPPPDPRRSCPDLAPWMARLILRLLEKDPARRFADATALRKALAGPTDAIRLLLQLSAGVLLLLLGASLLHGFTRRNTPPGEHPWQPRMVAPLPEYDENADVPVLSPDGQMLAYATDRDGSYRLYVEPAAGGKARVLTPPDQHVAHASWAADGRSIYAMSRGLVIRVWLDGRATEAVAEDAIRAIACGPRLLLIEYMNSPGCAPCMRLMAREMNTELAVAAGERMLLQLPPQKQIFNMRCDRGGHHVAYVIGDHLSGSALRGDLWLHPLDGGPPRRLTSDGATSNPIFAADGRSIIFSVEQGDSFAIGEIAIGGGLARSLVTSDLPYLPGDISGDGKRLYFNNDLTTIQLYATNRQGVRRKIPHPIAEFRDIAVAPSGLEVLSMMFRGKATAVVAFSVADGSERRIAEGVDSFAISSEGREVVYTAMSDTAWRLMAVALSGGTPRRIAELASGTKITAAAPDGFVYLSEVCAQGQTRNVRRCAARVSLAGGNVERKGLAGWAVVVPAPMGAWRFTSSALRRAREFRIFAPGQALDDPKAVRFQAEMLTWMPDGRALLVWDGHALGRYTVDTATMERWFPLQESDSGIAVSPDGQIIYTAEIIGRVHRRVITNFDERPRVSVADAIPH